MASQFVSTEPHTARSASAVQVVVVAKVEAKRIGSVSSVHRSADEQNCGHTFISSLMLMLFLLLLLLLLAQQHQQVAVKTAPMLLLLLKNESLMEP